MEGREGQTSVKTALVSPDSSLVSSRSRPPPSLFFPLISSLLPLSGSFLTLFFPFHFRVLGRIFLLTPFFRTPFHDTLPLYGSLSTLHHLNSTSLFSMTRHLLSFYI
jgi:hypothetical protein